MQRSIPENRKGEKKGKGDSENGKTKIPELWYGGCLYEIPKNDPGKRWPLFYAEKKKKERETCRLTKFKRPEQDQSLT